MNVKNYPGLKYASVLLLSVFIVAACKSPKKLAKTVENIEFKSEPDALEVHGDSVLVTVQGKFPPKSFNKGAVVKFQPIMTYGDQEKPLKPLYLKGEKVKADKEKYGDAKTINYSKGGTFTYTDKVEYDPAMKKSNVGLDYTVKLESDYDDLDQCIAGEVDSAVNGTITTSLTVMPTDDVYLYDNFTPSDQGRTIVLHYRINEGFIRDTTLKGPVVRNMREFMRDTTVEFKNVIIRSYASPDGEFELNKTLTEQRAASAQKLVQNELKSAQITSVYDSNFVQQPDLGEDYIGMASRVRASDMSNKQQILDIINNQSLSPAEKETRIRALGDETWNRLSTEIFPPLRRSEVTFSGTVPNRSIEQIRSISTSKSYNDLSNTELILLAENTEDTAKKMEIYQHMADRWSDDWVGRNNVAALKLKQGKYDEARNEFEQLSKDFPDNDTITNNLGVAKRHQRDYNAARELYATAQRGGVEEGNNKGILDIKVGDYESAVSNFKSDQCDYNVALAYVLKGDQDMALQKIECIENKTADVYYLKAIANARKGDKEAMLTALRRSIEMDGKFRGMAKEDLEFRKYREMPEFQNALR